MCSSSAFDLTHTHAQTVLEALQGAGLDPFLVDERDGHVVFGLDHEQRRAALAVLTSTAELDGWTLRWVRGRLGGGFRLGESRPLRHRVAVEATLWDISRPFAVAGIDPSAQSVRVTFWQRGQRWEQIGVRGQQRFELDTPDTVEHLRGGVYPGKASFPVERRPSQVGEPIDVVYTWVDGDDPAWRHQFDRWTRPQNIDEAQGVHPARFTSNDELRYSLRSVSLYAGWVRTIFIVTNGQRPEWLVDDDRIRLVSHDQILPSDALPTFNSHAIEARLHHIDGLADRFMYFNDDVFLGRPVAPEDFFTGNGLTRVPLSDARILVTDKPSIPSVDAAAMNGRALIEKVFDRTVELKLAHAPFPIRRQHLDELCEHFSGPIEQTIYHRFRTADDISTASQLVHHYALVSGRAIPGGLRSEYVHVESARLRSYLRRLLWGREFDTFCINATDSPASDLEAAQRHVTEFLQRYFPQRAPWERSP